MKRKRNLPRGGHHPDNHREAFQAALEAFRGWLDGPEPVVEYDGRPMLISIIMGKLWNCRDQLDWDTAQDVHSVSGDFEWCSRSQSYGSAARHLRKLMGIRGIAIDSRDAALQSKRLQNTAEILRRISR